MLESDYSGSGVLSRSLRAISLAWCARLEFPQKRAVLGRHGSCLAEILPYTPGIWSAPQLQNFVGS